jgi:hypothetical protein
MSKVDAYPEELGEFIGNKFCWRKWKYTQSNHESVK